jgi:hypothetical protein
MPWAGHGHTIQRTAHRGTRFREPEVRGRRCEFLRIWPRRTVRQLGWRLLLEVRAEQESVGRRRRGVAGGP